MAKTTAPTRRRGPRLDTLKTALAAETVARRAPQFIADSEERNKRAEVLFRFLNESNHILQELRGLRDSAQKCEALLAEKRKLFEEEFGPLLDDLLTPFDIDA